MNKEYHAVGIISTAEQTLNKANALLALAKEHPEHCQTLSACATMLLASALEQGIYSIISYRAESEAMEEGVDVGKTSYAALMKQPIREKMQSLPNLLTDGRFDLNYRSSFVGYLERLIARRNKLVHINEDAIHLITPNKQMINTGTHMIIVLPVPENIWDSVSLEEAERYQEAVGFYLREVLFLEPEEIKAGEIVAPVLVN